MAGFSLEDISKVSGHKDSRWVFDSLFLVLLDYFVSEARSYKFMCLCIYICVCICAYIQIYRKPISVLICKIL